MSQPPALITTVHDPERRLLHIFREAGEALAIYSATYAFVTDNTHPDVIHALRAIGGHVEVGPPGVPGIGQRRVLASAVQADHKDMFYCDFDRWLHWAGSYPKELFSLPERMSREHAEAWFICLGRTERAMATHPVAQSLPEAATNRALSTVAGKSLDATAGASWVRLAGARLILSGSTVTTKATDLEWPGLILRVDSARVQGAFVEGLEFETPDGYAEEIARTGSIQAWIRSTYDRPHVLRDRLQLAADSISALINVTSDTDFG
ncbi:MAG: hypothetical protein M3457_08165 [Chloroflexota bacterium]|nr:hypothetical protein [Chloroflexota bacterium]